MTVFNEQTTERVYIDVDIVYADFLRSITWQRIKEKIPQVEILIEARCERVRVRPSSSGNAHIEIKFSRPLHILENFCVRAWLHDDVYRLMLDHVRYLRTGDVNLVNRLWSGKAKQTDFKMEMKLCGDWVTIPLSELPRDPQPVDTTEHHQEYIQAISAARGKYLH